MVEIKLEDNIVIVIDVSNYKGSYQEEVPFKAKVIEKYEIDLRVKSIETGKEYELYYDQILEACSKEELKNLIDIKKYGDAV